MSVSRALGGTSIPGALGAFPVLSLAERDRRHARLRLLMEQQGLDAIVVFPGGPERLERYVTNETISGIAVLGTSGPAAYVVGRVQLPRHDRVGAAFERWVDDVRLGPAIPTLVAALADLAPGAVRVGVVGLSSRSVGAGAGYIPFAMWEAVRDALPGVEFVDVSVDVEHVVLVKSEEELEMIRASAVLGEAASAAFVAATAVGVRESEVVAAAFQAIVAGGGELHGLSIIERSGSHRFGWAAPEWLSMGGGSRVLERRDTISAEIFAHYGGFQTQQQIDVSLGEPDELLRRLEAACVESYRIGVSMIAPGARFGEIAAAMEAPILDAGFWNTGPQIQTVSPVMYNSATHQNTAVDPALSVLPALPPVVPQDGDFVLEPGVVFAVQPNALLDGRRVSIGGAVAVTSDGAEEMNRIPLRLNVRGD